MKFPKKKFGFVNNSEDVLPVTYEIRVNNIVVGAEITEILPSRCLYFDVTTEDMDLSGLQPDKKK